MLQQVVTPTSLSDYTEKDLLEIGTAYEANEIAEAGENFWYFRQLMNPKFLLKDHHWFPLRVAVYMRSFYNDMIDGKRPILLLSTPPQHGKSLAVLDLVAWAVGRDPNLRVIYSSFSDRLGVRANLRLQRAIDSRMYRQIFPETYLSSTNVVTLASRYLRNHDVLEFVGHEGYFRNTTVLGSITGEALDLSVVDDPIKGRAEASSELTREKTWNWLTDDVFSRFSEKAAIIMIMCMAGDTAVRMADGSEKPLRDVRCGDRVATYVNGHLETSRVVNWVNHGPDFTYEIRMSSGTIVRANERHPFLVMKDGVQQWVRLKNLRSGDVIVRAIPRMERGKVSRVASLIASTFEITHDIIESITFFGEEDVFDVQIEDTENFIANGLISHNTRWHVDDPAGRLIEHFGNRVRQIRFPAIAEQDGHYRKKGEALFPELKSMEFLQERRQLYTESSWSALYQQTPIVLGGGIFPIEKITVLPVFNYADIVKSVRYIDKAGCLIAGTMITTARGDVPIEQVRAGDQALTRNGYRTVTRAWLSKHTPVLTSVVFDNNTVLTGTPDHPLYCGGYWIELGNVRCHDRAWQITETLNAKSASLQDAVTRASSVAAQSRMLVTSTAMSGTNRPSVISAVPCIETSGRTRTGPYPIAVIFTTRTKTGITTTSKILSASASRNIINFTAPIPHSSKRCDDGIRVMVQSCEQLHKQLFANASVTSASNVAQLSSPVVSRRSSARTADLSELLNALGVPVYDLTVEGGHEFFANGLLVHNTQDGGAYTAMVLMHQMKNGTFVVSDVARGQWSALEREQQILACAKRDTALLRYGYYEIGVEQEPGSGGKESAESTIRNLAGYRVFADKPGAGRSKEIRAEPFAAQVQGANVYTIAGPWIRDYLSELELFPNGKYVDQVDASSGAFNKLTAVPVYNLDAMI